MIKIYLKYFALTGDFGPVKIGMTKNQVFDFLGEPDTEQDFGTGYTGVLYSWYELYFETETGILASIQNDHLQASCSGHREMIYFKNDKFEIDTWFLRLNQDLTKKEIVDILEKQKILYKEEVYFGNEIIKFESGVYLDFDKRGEVLKNNEKFVLNGIRYFPNLN